MLLAGPVGLHLAYISLWQQLPMSQSAARAHLVEASAFVALIIIYCFWLLEASPLEALAIAVPCHI